MIQAPWRSITSLCGFRLRAGALALGCFLGPSLPLPAQGAVAMVADLTGTAALVGGGPLGITSEIPAQRTLTVDKGGRLVLIRMATGEQFLFIGPCKARFTTEGRPEGTLPAETRRLPVLQSGLLPARLQYLAQAGLVMREKIRPDPSQDFAPGEAEREPSLEEELEKAQPKPDAPFSERVVFATLVERYGRKDQARKQWKALAQERPGDETLRALSER